MTSEDPRTEPRTAAKIGTWFWHVHHEVLCEPLTEPLANRWAYIDAYKPEHERAIRKALMNPVRGPLPPALLETRDAYNKAWAALDKAKVARDTVWPAYVEAGAAYFKAKAAYDKAGAAALPELEALHAIEHPDCPWNGHTIFPREDGARILRGDVPGVKVGGVWMVPAAWLEGRFGAYDDQREGTQRGQPVPPEPGRSMGGDGADAGRPASVKVGRVEGGGSQGAGRTHQAAGRGDPGGPVAPTAWNLPGEVAR